MKNWKKFPRVLFLLTLLISLLAGLSAPALVSQSASAAPMKAAALDVIINEVAWAGTSSATTSDEWIELYNATNASIDFSLSTWTLSDGGDINITLSGIIPAKGYYLLERYETTTDIPSNQLNSGKLNNTTSVETLTLTENLSNTIDTANADGGGWNGGSASPNYYSMERIGVIPDSVAAWTSNDGVIRNGLNGDTPVPAPINGTPKQQNSAVSVDLSLAISPPSVAVTSGMLVSFTATLTNSSSIFTATGISVDVTLPSGLSGVSITPSLGTYSSGVWSLASLPPGSATLIISGNALSGGIVAVQISSSNQVDPASSNNSASSTISVGSADLSITNFVNTSAPKCGTNVVFTIEVFNPATGDDATGVQIVDTLPDGLTYISADHPVTYAVGAGIETITWDVGALAKNTSQKIKITAAVKTNTPIVNSARISHSDQIDSNLLNNSANVVVTPDPNCIADLSLSQTWIRSMDIAGRVDLKLTVTNHATTNTATNVQVKDLLPSGLTYVSHTSGKSYSSNTGIWTVGTLEASPSANSISTLTITAKAAVDGDGTTNFAEVWRSDQYDPDSTPANGDIGEDDDTTNNSGVIGPDVKVADLSLTQTADIDALGTNAVFTITVSNGDADDASDVKVETSFAGYTLISNNSSGSFDTTTRIWDIDGLKKNTSRTLVVTTVPTIAGVFPENWAQVSDSTQVDPDSLPGNCENAILTCTEDDDAGAPSADLSLAQVITSPSPYKISDISTKVTFRITITNLGYADATGVQVKDLLPSGLTYSAHVPSTDNYVKGTGLWTIGNLAKNASRTLDITATVSSYGIKTNWAEVWKSGQSDPDSQPGDSSTTDDDDDSQIVISSRSVILNEVAWSGTAASAEDEWIELYNPSKADITLTGWKIKKNGCDSSGTDYINLANGGKIAASGYLLLERGATATDNTTVLDIAANQIYLASSTPVLSNSGEVLYLCDQNGNIIDTANKNEGTWPKGGGTNYASMERVGNTAESDSVWVSNTGVTKNGKNASGGAIYGTPGAKNSTGIAPTPTPITIRPTAVPIVRPVINEFLARPGYDWNQDGKVDVFDEFIEIKNIGIIDVNLNGWQLDDEEGSGSAPFKIPAAILKPGQRAIFYGLQTNILLGDGGDTVRLINPSGKIYDAYTYALVRLEDQSVCRLPDGGSGWYEDCVPTPNLTNTREGTVPSMPGGEVFESPTCDLPDTLPADFLFAECRGYGADVWRSFYWDKLGWQGDQPIPENMSKWESFIE